jgi:hypothetical protein
MTDFGLITSILGGECDEIVFEVQKLAEQFRETNFFGSPVAFPYAHLGYAMVCMGRIDLLSAYWKGDTGKQTARMRDFMNSYLDPAKSDEHRIMIQMFRHTLMHTGGLRFLYDKNNHARYTWRLHFMEFPAPYRHYTITREDPRHQDQLLAPVVSTGSTVQDTRAMNVEIVHFALDVREASRKYCDDLKVNTALQANYEKVSPKITIQELP